MLPETDERVVDPKMRCVLDEMKGSGFGLVSNLSARLNLSESTVRRVLVRLEKNHLVSRFHGGAFLSAGPQEVHAAGRAGNCAREKLSIGRAAARLADDGDAVLLRAGTTVSALIPCLREKRDLKIITNDLSIVHELGATRHRVILTGGEVDFAEQCTTGSLTPAAMKVLRARRLFTGAMGIHPEFGLMSDKFEEVEITRSFIEACEEVVVLVDHTKFGVVGPAILSPLKMVDIIVTDEMTPTHWILEFERRGIRVITSTISGEGAG